MKRNAQTIFSRIRQEVATGSINADMALFDALVSPQKLGNKEMMKGSVV